MGARQPASHPADDYIAPQSGSSIPRARTKVITFGLNHLEGGVKK